MSTQHADPATGGPALEAWCRMLDRLPAAGSVCDAEGRLVHYSPLAAQLWGRSPALGPDAPRYCGAPRLAALDGAPLRHEHSPMARALRQRTPVHGEHLRIGRPDGSERVVLVHASPLLDADGVLQGGVNMFVDVTERHAASRAEVERLRQREELRLALACDIRAGLDPLRRSALDLAARAGHRGPGPGEDVDRQLRRVTELVDRLLNLEVDLDDAVA